MGKLVGPYIKMLREQHGMSMRQLAQKLPCTPAYISLVERGQREISIWVLYTAIQELQGNFTQALFLLARDAGVPESELDFRKDSRASSPEDVETIKGGTPDDKRQTT